MAESTPFGDEGVSRAKTRAGVTEPRKSPLKIKQIVLRSVFWSYERGSWQYDVIVLIILAFIFLAGPSFQERPTMELSNLRHVQGVVELSHDKTSHTYQIDARLVESLAPRKPEEAVEAILHQSLKKPVAVKSVERIRDKKNSNVILGYLVKVEP